MKKAIIFILVVIVLFVGALLAIPVFFKKDLLNAAQNTLNKQLNAEVELNGLKLSLFKSFPDVSAEFQNIIVKGKGEFEQDTLLSLPLIRTKMNIFSLFNQAEMSIEEIVVVGADVRLIVSEGGQANWDVAPASGNTAVSSTAKQNEDEFQLKLEKIEIRDAQLVYNDKMAKMRANLSNIDFDLSGKMFGYTTQLQTHGTVENITFLYEEIQYVSNTSLDVKTLLDADFDKMQFDIADNELLINKLPLELSGQVVVPNDTTFLNLQLKTKESDFQNFLALVPPVYEEYLNEITTAGSATISGEINGFYLGEIYPEINLEVKVADGNLQYANMPEEINNIRAELTVSKTQGVLDLMQVQVKEAHAEIRNNPVNLTLQVSNPVSDPYFDGTFIGKVNLSHLKDALPLDSVNLAGEIDANLYVKGNYSDIENEAYDKIRSDGTVLLSNLVYDSPDFTQQIIVPEGKLNLSPESVNLQVFKMKVGQSDFHLSGKVSNYINYVLKDGLLQGNLNLISSYTNFNELLRLQADKEQLENTATTAKDNEEEEVVLAFDVPENIDLTFRSSISSAVLGNVPISNIKGEIRAANQKLLLDGLKMNMLDGQMTVNGSYKNTAANQPLFDFGFDISGFDIPAMYQTMSGVRKMLPGAGNSTGKLSTNLGMKGRLSPQLNLISASTNGKGNFSTQNVEIKDSPLFNQLSGILKKEKLRNVTVEDFTANITVEDGSVLLRPFTTKVIGQETKVQGSLNAESLLDMRLDFNVEREMFGPDIEKILTVIPGNQKITMLPAGVLIKGPAGKPKVSMDLSQTQKAVTEATKDDLKKSLDQIGKGLKKFFK